MAMDYIFWILAILIAMLYYFDMFMNVEEINLPEKSRVDDSKFSSSQPAALPTNAEGHIKKKDQYLREICRSVEIKNRSDEMSCIKHEEVEDTKAKETITVSASPGTDVTAVASIHELPTVHHEEAVEDLTTKEIITPLLSIEGDSAVITVINELPPPEEQLSLQEFHELVHDKSEANSQNGTVVQMTIASIMKHEEEVEDMKAEEIRAASVSPEADVIAASVDEQPTVQHEEAVEGFTTEEIIALLLMIEGDSAVTTDNELPPPEEQLSFQEFQEFHDKSEANFENNTFASMTTASIIPPHFSVPHTDGEPEIEAVPPKPTVGSKDTSADTQPDFMNTGESELSIECAAQNQTNKTIRKKLPNYEFFITELYEEKYLTFIRNVGPSKYTSLFHDSHRDRLVVKRVIPWSIVSKDDFYRAVVMIDRFSRDKRFPQVCGHYQAEGETSVLFTEYFHGCHFDKLFRNHAMPPLRLQKVLWEIFKGIRSMSSQHVVHCDIQGENILVNESDKIKIVGFGRSVMEYSEEIRYGCVGYAAPEVLAQWYGSDIEKPSSQCDVYSVGAMVFFHIFRHFPGYSSFDVLHKVVDQEIYNDFINSGVPIAENGMYFPPGLDPLLEDLLKKLLEPDPELRYTADDALRHPYFSQDPKQMSANFPGPMPLAYKAEEEGETGVEKEATVSEFTADQTELFHPQQEQSASDTSDSGNEGDEIKFPEEDSTQTEKIEQNKKGKWKRFKQRLRWCKGKKSSVDEMEHPTRKKKKNIFRRFISRIFHPHKKDKRQKMTDTELSSAASDNN